MEKDLVSVIVPVYNVEKYVSKCIESLLNQTYKHVEIIIVDDGSTDKSGAICDKIAESSDNIRVIHKKNEGLGYARNTGLEYVNGEFVVFVDSDDWVSDEFISNLYDGIKKNGVDYCKSGFDRVKNDGEVVSHTKYCDEIFLGAEASRSLFPRMLGSAPDKYDSIEMSACAVIYRTEIIQRNHIRFPSERVIISEDIVFNMDYLNACNGAATISDRNYMYRVNDVSLTHTYRADRFNAYLYFYSVISKKLLEYGYGEDALNRLKRIFFVYIRSLIRMEANHTSVSPISRLTAIHDICADVRLQSIIQGYPIRKLQFKPKVFVLMLKKELALVLYVLARVGIM